VFPQHFSFSQTSTRVSIKQLDYELKISMRDSWLGDRNLELTV